MPAFFNKKGLDLSREPSKALDFSDLQAAFVPLALAVPVLMLAVPNTHQHKPSKKLLTALTFACIQVSAQSKKTRRLY
jgi:hypothetical protein